MDERVCHSNELPRHKYCCNDNVDKQDRWNGFEPTAEKLKKLNEFQIFSTWNLIYGRNYNAKYSFCWIYDRRINVCPNASECIYDQRQRSPFHHQPAAFVNTYNYGTITAIAIHSAGPDQAQNGGAEENRVYANCQLATNEI